MRGRGARERLVSQVSPSFGHAVATSQVFWAMSFPYLARHSSILWTLPCLPHCESRKGIAATTSSFKIPRDHLVFFVEATGAQRRGVTCPKPHSKAVQGRPCDLALGGFSAPASPPESNLFEPLDTLSPYRGHFHVFEDSVPSAGKALPPCPFALLPFNLWLALGLIWTSSPLQSLPNA